MNTKYFVPALEKGLDVLEALAKTDRPLSLTELAHQLNRSASELFRLLSSLEARRYVVKDAGAGAYSLSLKLYELAHQHPPELNLIQAASAPLEGFARRTDESCHISVLRAGEVIVLKEALTASPIRLSAATGAAFPALRSSSGRLLLAYLEPGALDAFFESSAAYQALPDREKRALRARLAKIRASGVSTSENENHVGIRDAAVLVGNPAVGFTAALASTWLTPASREDRTGQIIKQLQRGAAEITAAMGLKHDKDHLL